MTTETTGGKAIYAALIKAQMEMEPAKKDSDNPHFKSKYADLASIIEACVPALNAHGIAVVQPFFATDLGNYVKTVFLHESGETLECSVPLLLSKQDMQGLGSAITYARRYGLLSMAGIAPDDDDDEENSRKSAPVIPGGIGDAWRDAVMDNLPPNATPRQTAEAFAKAICEDFKGKGIKALENRWDRHKKMIGELENRFSDLHEKVIDAYEMRVQELTPSTQV